MARRIEALRGRTATGPHNFLAGTSHQRGASTRRRPALARYIVLLDLFALILASLPALIPLTAPGYVHPALLIQFATSVDLVTATKAVFGINLILAGIGAYLLSRQVLRHRGAALFSGLLYMYAPFTLVEIYVRSNLAGLAGLALLPFVLVTFLRLCERPSMARAGVGAAVLAAPILAHHDTGAIAAGMAVALVAFHFVRRRDRRVLAFAALALTLAIGATSFYWVPILLETPWYTHAESLFTRLQDFHLHFVDPLGDQNNVSGQLYDRFGYSPDLLTRFGPFDLHLAYPYGSPPFKLSLFQGVLLLVSGVALSGRRTRPLHVVSLYLLGLVFFFLTLTWSRPVWEAIPIYYFLQFPWQLTEPVGLCLAVVGPWAMLSVPRPGSSGPTLLIHETAVLVPGGRASSLPGREWLVLSLMGLAGVASSLWMLPMWGSR